MLNVTRETPKAERIELGHGGWVMARPATTADTYLVESEVTILTAGLIAGGNSASFLATLFGDSIDLDVFNPIHAAAIAQRFSVLKLAERCVEGIGGIEVDGAPMTVTLENLALLLKDPRISVRLNAVISRSLYKERDEGNGFAASLSGAAAADDLTVPDAPPKEARVPAAAGA